MKTSPLLLFLCVSCSLLEPELQLGESRVQEKRVNRSGAASPSSGAAVRDTTFLVSAVCFPRTYDWQRDSSFGAVACTLKLYRNWRTALQMPAGAGTRVSPAPDCHHIIGPSLYTEYSDRNGTAVKKDGVDICSWSEPEKLQGLLYKDGVLHTIGVARSSGALCYRRDGEQVLKVDSAVLLGAFGSNGRTETGALYEDSGTVCFAYKTELGGMSTAWMFRDGEVRAVLTAPEIRILDAKMMDGECVVLYNQLYSSVLSVDGKARAISDGGGVYWQEGELLKYEGRIAVAGTYLNYKGYPRGGLGWEGCICGMVENTPYIYCDGEYFFGLAQPPSQHSDCFFFNRCCACQIGASMAVALTPRDVGQLPFVQMGDRLQKFNLYGYLSAIAVEID